MNFNAPLFKLLRILLFPFSLVYGLIIWFRNKMYDNNILRSASFELPVICVGNLSAGGTGKSPMVEYLIRQLLPVYSPAILSRGYKRKTKGYLLAANGTTAREIGDEPMQFHQKFPGITVAVGEERILAIPQLLHDRPETNVVIMDDAFQHRSVKAGLNILLTDFSHLFTRDWFLPTGNLRDAKSSYKRADVIVVTKSNPAISNSEKDMLVKEIRPLAEQQVFFTAIQYGEPYHIISVNEMRSMVSQHILLVSGIANPLPLKNHITEKATLSDEIIFPDHHNFSAADLALVNERFHRISSKNKMILTTEKDAVRLLEFKQQIQELPIYVIPIQTRFLFDGEHHFNDIISTFIEASGK